MSALPEDARLYIRLNSAQRSRIDKAAEVEGRTVTDFALVAMTDRAEHVLADRRLFQLDDAASERFRNLLERPVAHKPRLAELLEREPPSE